METSVGENPQDMPSVTQARWSDALWAPWRWILHPARAADCMIRAPRGAVLVSLAIGAVLLAGTVLAVVIWDYALDLDFSQMPLRRMPRAATTPTASANWLGHPVRRHSAAEVWSDWHSRGAIGEAEAIVFGVAGLWVACVAFGAWLHLVNVHETGAVWASYKRAFRSVISCMGLLVVMTITFGLAMAAADRAQTLRWETGVYVPPLIDPWAFMAVATPAAICLVLVWCGRAVRGACGVGPIPSLNPRCEGCGYDLTHIPANQRCPECGLDVTMSLTPRYWRAGCPWEDHGGFTAWLQTSLTVMVDPHRFYARLQVRTSERPSRRFAWWQYVAIGVAGTVWAHLLGRATGQHDFGEVVIVPIMCGFIIPELGWLIHRTIGAVAASWCLVRGELADSRWMRKVIAYESVYLWVIGLYNAALIFSFATRQLWLSGLFGKRIFWVLGMPIEIAALLFGNCVLGLIWLWRYHRAVRAVRWSNF